MSKWEELIVLLIEPKHGGGTERHAAGGLLEPGSEADLPGRD